MVNILIISTDQRVFKVIPRFQPLLKGQIGAVTDFDVGLKEVFDKRPSIVFIQGEISGVAGSTVASHIKGLLRDEAPRTVLLKETGAQAKDQPGAFDDAIDVGLPEEEFFTAFRKQLDKIASLHWKDEAPSPEAAATPAAPATPVAASLKPTTPVAAPAASPAAPAAAKPAAPPAPAKSPAAPAASPPPAPAPVAKVPTAPPVAKAPTAPPAAKQPLHVPRSSTAKSSEELPPLETILSGESPAARPNPLRLGLLVFLAVVLVSYALLQYGLISLPFGPKATKPSAPVTAPAAQKAPAPPPAPPATAAPAPAPPPSAAPQPAAPTPAAPNPAAPSAPAQPATNSSRLPGVLSLGPADTAYAKAHPGWERFTDARREVRVFREKGAIRALQVIARQEGAITPALVTKLSTELIGSADLKAGSRTERDGYVIEKGTVMGRAEYALYRNQKSGQIRALVITLP